VRPNFIDLKTSVIVHCVEVIEYVALSYVRGPPGEDIVQKEANIEEMAFVKLPIERFSDLAKKEMLTSCLSNVLAAWSKMPWSLPTHLGIVICGLTSIALETTFTRDRCILIRWTVSTKSNVNEMCAIWSEKAH
jgi:hypothetical protein